MDSNYPKHDTYTKTTIILKSVLRNVFFSCDELFSLVIA